MHLFESLFHPQLLFALAIFAIISVVVEVAAYKLLLAVGDVESSHWIMARIIVPAARTLALVSFILIAYPVLYGVELAAPIGELLDGGKLRLSNLVNLVFILSLFLPLIPLFNRLPALVLPIQGIAAATMVFNWWTESYTHIQFWPGSTTVIGMLILAFLTHEVAQQLAHHLEKKVDAWIEREGSGRLIYRTVVMVLQVPVIWLYTQSLGQQLY